MLADQNVFFAYSPAAETHPDERSYFSIAAVASVRKVHRTEAPREKGLLVTLTNSERIVLTGDDIARFAELVQILSIPI